jgi:RHS repeat-associated protein
VVYAEKVRVLPCAPGSIVSPPFAQLHPRNVVALGINFTLGMAISANNQFTTTGFSYDASGNVLAAGTNTYTWNAESEIKTAAGVNYTYDGDGDRVQKSNGKIYWYGAGSEILDESDSSGNITDEYVFFGGKRIAHRVVSGNAIYYYAEDFLGSSRVMTTSAGTVCYDADFYPYGGERVVTNTCPQNYKFTGKERDAETSNDDFGARYYSSQFGRWISPDWSAIPAPVPYANLTNPQTLNLYAMVHDNPETFADLDGHDIICLSCLAQKVTQYIQSSPTAQAAIGVGKQMFDNFVGKDVLQPSNSTQQAAANVMKNDVGPAVAIIAPFVTGEGAVAEPEMAPTPQVAPPLATDFVVTPQGEAIPIPDGASGPLPTKASGMQYQGGSGGKGMDDQVSGVRIMDANDNQGARVSYNNAQGQKVNPTTGQTVSKADPSAHIPLKAAPQH